jgi:hypothetical protein
MLNNLYRNIDLSAKGVWFPIVFGIIILTLVVLMPKRLSKKEIYFTVGVVGYVALILDIFVFAIALDVFDLGNSEIVGIGDIISYGIISPCMALLFLNFYKKEKKWVYVSIFTIISFLYEVVLVNIGYMDLHGWNSLFSIPVHIVSFGFWFPYHLKLMRR